MAMSRSAVALELARTRGHFKVEFNEDGTASVTDRLDAAAAQWYADSLPHGDDMSLVFAEIATRLRGERS